MNYSKRTIKLNQENTNLKPDVEIDIASCEECIATVIRFGEESHTQIVFLEDAEKLRKELT